jgi:hypothetical protein
MHKLLILHPGRLELRLGRFRWAPSRLARDAGAIGSTSHPLGVVLIWVGGNLINPEMTRPLWLKLGQRIISNLVRLVGTV